MRLAEALEKTGEAHQYVNSHVYLIARWLDRPSEAAKGERVIQVCWYANPGANRTRPESEDIFVATQFVDHALQHAHGYSPDGWE